MDSHLTLRPKGNPVVCRICKVGTMCTIEREQVFHPPGKTVTVKTLAAACSACKHEAVLASQHAENLRRRAARASEYGGLLLGENIFSFRRRYALTQEVAGRLFGKSALAFSRYENERSFPDLSTTKLLRLAIANPEVVRWLAKDAGVELPLESEEPVALATP